MPKPISGTIVAVFGPKPFGRSHRVRIKTADGKVHSRSFKVPADAAKWADQWRSECGNFDAVKRADFRPYDGTTGWWVDLLAKCALELWGCEDYEAKDDLRKDLNALAQAAKAIRTLIDNTKLEGQMADLEQQVKEILTQRKHGVGTRWTPASAPEQSTHPEPLS